jgi:hypothetical protein
MINETTVTKQANTIAFEDACRIFGPRRTEVLLRSAENVAQAHRAEVMRLLRKLKKPITLRDVRKADTTRAKTALYRAAEIALAVLAGDLTHQPVGYVSMDVIDRLIKQYGPDFQLDPYLDEYIKATDRVKEAMFSSAVARVLELIRTGKAFNNLMGDLSWALSDEDYLKEDHYVAAERELARRQGRTTDMV